MEQNENKNVETAEATQVSHEETMKKLKKQRVRQIMTETIDSSDYTVKIPMYHGADSLNVAAASAVAFWELGRRS